MLIRRITLLSVAALAALAMADDSAAPATQPVLRTVEQIERYAQRETDAARKAYEAELAAVRARRIERLKRARDLAYADHNAKLWATLDALLEAKQAHITRANTIGANATTQPTNGATADGNVADDQPTDGRREHIIFIADCTGSMFATNAFKAQQAFLREQIQDINADAAFAIAVMGGLVDPTDLAYVTADDQAKQRAMESIGGMQARGQVPMTKVLTEVLKLRPTTVWIVYQMPDTMEPTSAIVNMIKTARRAAHPPTFNVVCVDLGYEAEAKTIAAAGGGTMVMRPDE